MAMPISPEHRRNLMRLAAQRGRSYAELEREFKEIVNQMAGDGAQQHTHVQAMNTLCARHTGNPPPIKWFPADSPFASR